jgi:hypothetical protein
MGKFETPFQAPDRPVPDSALLTKFTNALARAKTAATEMGTVDRACELTYLGALSFFMQTPFNFQDPNMQMYALAARSKLTEAKGMATWDNKSCATFDGDGIARHLGAVNDLLWNYYLDGQHDFNRALAHSAEAEQAYREAITATPRNPVNYIWYVALHERAPVIGPPTVNAKNACDNLKTFITAPTAPNEVGLEPAFGEFRSKARDIYNMRSICRATSGPLP